MCHYDVVTVTCCPKLRVPQSLFRRLMGTKLLDEGVVGLIDLG